MNSVELALEAEKERLNDMISHVDLDAGTACNGSFYVTSINGNNYYYRKKMKNGKRSSDYVGAEDSERLSAEIVRLKREALRRLIQKDLDAIDRFLVEYLSPTDSEVERLVPRCLSGIKGGLFMDDRYEDLKAWANAEYERNSHPYPDAYITAKDGRRVRSKGEALWCNAFLDAGVPFRDDPLLRFDVDGLMTEIAPDFQIKCFDDSYILVEHAGLLGNNRYLMEFAGKIHTYIKAGYTLGKDLIVTSDDIFNGTDSAMIEEYVEMIARRVFQ